MAPVALLLFLSLFAPERTEAATVPPDGREAGSAENLSWLSNLSSVEGPALALPSDPIVMFLRYPGPRSRFQMIFSDVPEGMSVQNDVGYDGWCVDRQRDIPKNTTTPVRLYSSADPMLPGHLAGLPWKEINYLVNHKNGKPSEVQAAIWHLVDGRTKGLTPTARSLAEEARRNGPRYAPGPGDIVAVICEPFGDWQTTFIELPLPVVLGVEGEAPDAPAPPEPGSQSTETPAATRVLPGVFSIVDPGDSGGNRQVIIIDEREGGGGDQEPPPNPVPLPAGAVLLGSGLGVLAVCGVKW